MAKPVQTISYFARRLIQLEQKFARREPTHLRATAELFRAASDKLDDLLDALEDGEAVESACISLLTLLPGLEIEVYAEVGPPECDKIVQAMRDAVNPERVAKQFSESEDRPALMEELDKAAILVRALADGLNLGEQVPH